MLDVEALDCTWSGLATAAIPGRSIIAALVQISSSSPTSGRAARLRLDERPAIAGAKRERARPHRTDQWPIMTQRCLARPPLSAKQHRRHGLQQRLEDTSLRRLTGAWRATALFNAWFRSAAAVCDLARRGIPHHNSNGGQYRLGLHWRPPGALTSSPPSSASRPARGDRCGRTLMVRNFTRTPAVPWYGRTVPRLARRVADGAVQATAKR